MINWKKATHENRNFCGGFKLCENEVPDYNKEKCKECIDDYNGAIEQALNELEINDDTTK